MTTVKNIYDYINTIAPFNTQEEWDNSGFLVGEYRKEVKKAVVTLDATKETVAYAKSVGADLIISHHPLIFKGAKNVFKGSSLYELIHNDIALISSHTPYDKTDGGINDNLAQILGLQNIRRHDNGYLVFGELKDSMSIDDFALFVAQTLDSHGLRYTDCDKTISTVCVGGGACAEFIADAMECSDCFVTGDLKYHEMLDAQQDGFAVVSAGHFETENIPFLMIKERLEKIFTDVKFFISPVKNPVLEI